MIDDTLSVTTSDGGNSFTVAKWLDTVKIAPVLLTMTPLIETVVTFRATNGTRRYRVVDANDDRAFVLKLLPEESA